MKIALTQAETLTLVAAQLAVGLYPNTQCKVVPSVEEGTTPTGERTVLYVFEITPNPTIVTEKQEASK